ncbi:MAG: hypothetical protein SGILL_009694 [Bacillariaceae sp.]
MVKQNQQNTANTRKPSFQIRTAVVGTQGCGKTALLNALFQRKVTHCSSEYGTKSINRFHVVSSSQQNLVDDDSFEATKAINEKVVSQQQGIPVKDFYITLDESEISTPGNVELVFEDVPGCLRGQDFSDYMISQWEDIDSLIFVADLQRNSYISHDEGLFNTLDILMKKKEVPLLIVGNKFDDVKDETTMKRATQVKQILEIMAAKQNWNAPAEYEEEEKKEQNLFQTPVQNYVRPPAFVSLSSRRALWYRYAAILSREGLQQDTDLIDEILVDCYGELKAHGMSKERKLQSVWTVLHGDGEDSLSEALKISSQQFDSFCRWIHETLCEGSAQRTILQKQQEACLQKLSSDDLEVVNKLRQIHLSPWTIPGGDSDSLVATFWALWHACEDNALADFSRTMDVSVFKAPLNHLCSYKSLLEETKWEGMIVVLSALQSLLQSQLKIIIKQHQQWSFSHWYKRRDQANWVRNEKEKRSWKSLSPMDWANMYSSILLVVNDRLVCTRMGKEKIMLDNLLQRSNEAIFSVQQQLQEHVETPSPSEDANKQQRLKLFSVKRRGKETSQKASAVPFHTSDGCPSLEKCLDGYFSLKNGALIPKYPATYSCVVNLKAPSSLDDPSHFGHVAFTYRNVMASIGKKHQR